MAFIEINPRYEMMLSEIGLNDAQSFLDLRGTVCYGHPDRNVSRIVLANGLTVYLKKEHCVRLRDRLRNFLDGFGFTSKSIREAFVLQKLEQAGVNCPDFIAAGEMDGKAFLLLREVEGSKHLLDVLGDLHDGNTRLEFATTLGKTLAHMHQSGFRHPDLCYKHILVRRNGNATSKRFDVTFLDWQRTAKKSQIRVRDRWIDLAFLNATLPSKLATNRERLHLLHIYLRECGFSSTDARRWLVEIGKRSQQLRKKRRIRELCYRPVLTRDQNLTRLDNAPIWITPAFRETFSGSLPDWLSFMRESDDGLVAECTTRRNHRGKELTIDHYVDARKTGFLQRLVRRRNPVSSGMRVAALLFRLQRHEIPAPQLLAVGERTSHSARVESFVLTATPETSLPLADWLRDRTIQPERRTVLQNVGQMLAAIHDAGIVVQSCPFVILENGHVQLGNVRRFRRQRKLGKRDRQRDLRQLIAAAQPCCAIDECRVANQAYWESAKKDLTAIAADSTKTNRRYNESHSSGDEVKSHTEVVTI